MNTPCVKVCVMDLDRGYCKGCYRTLDEIGRWSRMTDAERDQILSLLEERKLQVAKVAMPPLP
jgi:predicted Fe-S protein YdhL (DUF1289 family)